MRTIANQLQDTKEIDTWAYVYLQWIIQTWALLDGHLWKSVNSFLKVYVYELNTYGKYEPLAHAFQACGDGCFEVDEFCLESWGLLLLVWHRLIP